MRKWDANLSEHLSVVTPEIGTGTQKHTQTNKHSYKNVRISSAK